MPDNIRLATKEEILKNLKKTYNKRKMSYKEYILEVKKVEKYYDKWKEEFNKTTNQNNGENIDMTNEELAIGKRLSELQTNTKTIQEQESNTTLEEEDNKKEKED